MRKLILLAFLILTISGYSQDIIEADSLEIKGGGYFENNVQVPDPVGDLDAANKQWVLSQGGSGSGSDSIDFSSSTGDLRLLSGITLMSTANLDDRYPLFSYLLDYVLKSDSTGIYTTRSYVDSVISSTSQSVFTISLPINGTLSGSASSAVEGVDYPTGWVLTASGSDLQIEHGLNRGVNSISVKDNTAGVSYRHYRPFDDAYTGVFEPDNNNVTVESLTTDYKYDIIKISILFE